MLLCNCTPVSQIGLLKWPVSRSAVTPPPHTPVPPVRHLSRLQGNADPGGVRSALHPLFTADGLSGDGLQACAELQPLPDLTLGTSYTDQESAETN